jgi:predicted dehydrogenase
VIAAARAPALRVALLGLGRAGLELHLPALLRSRAFAEVLAFDPVAERRARAAELGAHPLEEAAASLGPEVEAVVIATPHETHAELAAAALRAGKAVYVEKPMATSTADALDLATLARGPGRTLQLGLAYRHHPLWRRAFELVRAGRLRPPLDVRAVFTSPGRGEGWRSPMVDLATHHLDLVGWIAGARLVAVRAEEGGGLAAQWGDGTRLRGDYGDAPPSDEVTIRDGSGWIAVRRMRRPWLSGRGIPLGLARRPHPLLTRALATRSGWEPAFQYALEAFARAATRRAPASPGPADGVRAVAASEAILRSLRTGAAEEVHGAGHETEEA